MDEIKIIKINFQYRGNTDDRFSFFYALNGVYELYFNLQYEY